MSTSSPPPRKLQRTEGSLPTSEAKSTLNDAATQFQARGKALTVAQYGAANQTIYINNLNDTISKQDLKANLYMLLSAYGDVISIVALKTPKMRGQAHVAFGDLVSATTALHALNGTMFLGKVMNMAFAKTKSHAIAKLDGTFVLGDDNEVDRSENPQGEDDEDATIAYQMDSDNDDEPTGVKRRHEEDN